MKNDSVATSKPVTSGQITKLLDRVRSIAEKSGLPSDAFQKMLEQDQSLNEGLLKLLQKHCDQYANMITRQVEVDRTRTALETIQSIQKVRSGGFIINEVVSEIPKNEGLSEEELSLVSCKDLLRDGELYVKAVDLPKRLAYRRYELVDFYGFGSFVEQNQELADKISLVTQWNMNCYAVADLWNGGRRLNVDRDDNDWVADAWFVVRPLRNN